LFCFISIRQNYSCCFKNSPLHPEKSEFSLFHTLILKNKAPALRIEEAPSPLVAWAIRNLVFDQPKGDVFEGFL